MSPVLDEASQLTPSQFAHLRPTEPTITTSGVTPGRALLDSPSPGRSPFVLERSQRTRKPTARKVEASQSQPSVSKSKGKESVKNSTNKNVGDASSARKSKEMSVNVNIANDNRNDDDDTDEFLSQTSIKLAEAFVGHSVSHLSHREIQKLIDAMLAAQTSTLETQATSAPAITESATGVGLAGGDRDGSDSHKGPGNQSLPQMQSNPTTGSIPLIPQKRPSDTSCSSAKLKHVRILQDDDDSPTEDESDDNDSDLLRRRHTNSTDDDDDEPLPPLPHPLSHLRYPSANSQGQTAARNSHSTRTLAAPKTASSTRPLPRNATNPIASTSSNNPPAPMTPFNTASYLTRNPPPNDLTDVNALAVWAIQIAKLQAQGLDDATSSSRSNPPSQRTTTADHVARAIASHRSQLNATNTQHHPNHESQPSSAGLAPHSSASTGDDTSGQPTGTGSGHYKPKHSAKSKLSDYPGPIGEVASAAIPYFLSTVLVDGAYENLETFRNWALDSYHLTWDLEFPEYEYEAPPKDVLTIMSRRVTWLRGEMKKRIRTIIQYGYGFRNPAIDRSDIKHNRRLAKKLGPNTFHCRDLIPNTNHFEHVQFIRAIGAGIFWDPESLGVAFHVRFKLVPIPAVALVLTMMQACISEWRTGTFKAEELNADRQQVEYERHLLGLYEYEKKATDRLMRFRQTWAAAGLEYSGATPDEDPTAMQPYALASDIRPDTPPPEHEVA